MPDSPAVRTHFSELDVPQRRVDQASRALKDAVQRMGHAEFFAVVEELAFSWGVDYTGEDGKFKLTFSGLQLVALAAALRARCESIAGQG